MDWHQHVGADPIMPIIQAPHPKFLLILELRPVAGGSDYSSATPKAKARKAVA